MATDFDWTRAQFILPENTVYLDGNSLGPLPAAAPARVEACVRHQWGQQVITGWNRSKWTEMPMRLGDRIGNLIGAEPGLTVVGDTLSIKVYQALAAALALRPDRRVVLSDTGNFPTDLYMAEGLIRTLGKGHTLRTVAPEDVAQAITPDVAVVMLTQVDYRTGRMHDMAALTQAAHDAGALVIWDLAHSAGAVEVDVSGCDTDFAVGCTYKYLNGGPGAPAFIYVASAHANVAEPALAGWFGHEQPFAFDLAYRPADGIARMRVGTPPVVQMAPLDVALDVWDRVDMSDLRSRSICLSERFIAGVETRCPGLILASPRDPQARGSQVSFRHAHGYAVMQALIADGVIGDFRAPDMIRFGFAPLYNTLEDVDRAVAKLADIMDTGRWDQPRFHARAVVT